MPDWPVADGLKFSRIREIWLQLRPEERTPDGLWAAIDGDNRRWITYLSGDEEIPAPTPERIFKWLQPDFAQSKIKLPNGILLDFDIIVPAFPARPNESVDAPSDPLAWIVWLEEQNVQILQACKDLEIDPYLLHEYYATISHKQFLREAEATRRIREIARNNNVSEYTLHRLLQSQIQPVSRAGNKSEKHYDAAFERVYILRSCTKAEAFELMLQEKRIMLFGENDRADRWQAFNQAMKRRNKNYRR